MKKLATKSTKAIYYDGLKRKGMDTWVLKAIYKVGKAAKRGKSVHLSPGRVREYLLGTHLIMKDHQGLYMLTHGGQVTFKNIKFK